MNDLDTCPSEVLFCFTEGEALISSLIKAAVKLKGYPGKFSHAFVAWYSRDWRRYMCVSAEMRGLMVLPLSKVIHAAKSFEFLQIPDPPGGRIWDAAFDWVRDHLGDSYPIDELIGRLEAYIVGGPDIFSGDTDVCSGDAARFAMNCVPPIFVESERDVKLNCPDSLYAQLVTCGAKQFDGELLVKLLG